MGHHSAALLFAPSTTQAWLALPNVDVLCAHSGLAGAKTQDSEEKLGGRRPSVSHHLLELQQHKWQNQLSRFSTTFSFKAT